MSDFLDFIQPGEGLTEIRSIKGDRVKQDFFASHKDAMITSFSLSMDKWDSYYGVLPRLSEDGADVPAHTWVVWADLDAKGDGEKAVALGRLLRYDLPPSVIVDSGHGYHAYWRLEAPTQWAYAEPIMRGLAKMLGGDHVYDAPRILRLPGTTNWKDQEHPAPVRLIRFDSQRTFDRKDFYREELLGRVEDRPVVATEFEYKDFHDLPEWLQILIATGAEQGRRSEESFKVVCSLIRHGWGRENILNVFETGGIGEKYREKGNGLRWFDLTYRKALQEVGSG